MQSLQCPKLECIFKQGQKFTDNSPLVMDLLQPGGIGFCYVDYISNGKKITPNFISLNLIS